MTTTLDQVRVLTLDAKCPAVPIVRHGGTASAVVWPGSGARFRTMHHIELEPNGQTIRLRHDGEAVYYVRQGTGHVSDETEGSSSDIAEGSIVFVEPGTPYQFTAASSGMILLGGPCPADPALYAPA